MSRSTEDLAAELAAAAGPVRRLTPPMARALVWLAVIALVAGVLILRFSNLPVFAARASDPRMAVELFGVLATGIAGVIAAFHLSVPDRPRAWSLLPVPFAMLWLGASGLGCWRDWGEQTAQGWRLGESSHCMVFLLAVGTVLGGALLVALRQARPLQPRLTATVGAVGIAALSAFFLQFFHPFDVTLIDLGAHLSALALLIAVIGLAGRPGLGGAAG
jgi:hypothetical protein